MAQAIQLCQTIRCSWEMPVRVAMGFAFVLRMLRWGFRWSVTHPSDEHISHRGLSQHEG